MSKVWRWTVVAVAAIPGAALADADQYSAFKLPSNVAVNVTGGAVNPDGSGVTSNSSINVNSPISTTTLSGTFSSAPPDPSLPADRDERKLGLNSDIKAPAGVAVSIQASSDVQNTRLTGSLVPAGLSSTSATTKTDSATAKATMQPFFDVSVAVGVNQSSSETTQDNVAVGGLAQRDTVSADDRKTFASATWSPLPVLQVQAGAANETMNVSARGTATAADTYRYTEPYGSATVSLWDGARVKVSGEDAVLPVNPYDFAALAQAAGPDSSLRVAPNREWRNEAGFSQNLDNGGTLSATVMQARIESATELGFTPEGLAAPMSVSGGKRRELDASLSMPLSGMGLPDTTISSQATLRQSQVRDPVTGQMRRSSGEIPREASVKVTHNDGAHHMEWGVTGNLATEQSFYQPAQVTALRTDSGVGAFITYKPGKYVVSLNASGLIGGARSQTDTFYLGSRSGNIESVNRTGDSSPLVSVSVSQKF